MTNLTLVKKTSFTCGSLAATLILSICTPASAFMFGTTGIQFDEDTSVNFTFDRSQNAYLSTLLVAQSVFNNTGYSNRSTLFNEIKPSDDITKSLQGSFGNAVTSPDGKITQTFTFLKNEIYALLLWSDTGSGNRFEQFVSTSTFMNSSLWFAAGTKFRKSECLATGCQQAVFGDFTLDYESDKSFSAVNNGKGPDQFQSLTKAQLTEGAKIAFDDGEGVREANFEQFSLTAQTAEVVPEPMSLLGTILGIGALATARSKKKQSQSGKK